MSSLLSKEEPIKMGEKVGYAVGDMACGMAINAASMYLTIFYTDVFGISAGIVGIIFLIARIADAITDPIMGMIIDRNQFKCGKFRPYIKWGIIPFVISIFLVFTVPPLPMAGKIIYATVTYITMGAIVYTMINVPYGALTSAMTRNQEQLTSITSVRLFFGNFGGLVVAFFVPILNEFFMDRFEPSRGYQLTMLTLSLLGAVMLFVCYKSTRERIVLPKHSEVVKASDIITLFKVNRPLVVMCVIFVISFIGMVIGGGTGAYYVTYNMNRTDLMKYFMLLGSIPALIGMSLVPMLVKNFGKKMTLYIASVVNIIGLLMLYFVPVDNISLIFTAKIIASLGGVIQGCYIWALVPELIVFGEYKTGKRMSGLIYAIIGFFFKLGMAIGGALLGFMLQLVHYVPNQVQTPQALHGILLLVSIIPAILSVLIMICVKKYELTEERYAEVVKVVEERERELNKQD